MENIKLEMLDHVAIVKLNRPQKKNSLDSQTILELSETFKSLDEKNQHHVTILMSEGNFFCAGADIVRMVQMSDASLEENRKDASDLAALFYAIYRHPKPTIALVQGGAYGGGIGLFAACDIAYVADDATFAFSEIKLGVSPSTISPYILRKMGLSWGQYYFLTGEQFDAKHALALQLCHKMVKASELVAEGLALAEKLAASSAEALQEIKLIVRMVSHEPIDQPLIQKTIDHLAFVRATPAAKKYLKSFLAKKLEF